MILRHLFSGVSGGFRQKCGINLPENIQSAARFPTLKFDPWILGHRWLWASWMDFVALWLTLAHFGSFCQFKATLGERTFSSFFSTSSRSFRCWVSDSPSPGSQDLSHSSKSGSFSSTSPEKNEGDLEMCGKSSAPLANFSNQDDSGRSVRDFLVTCYWPCSKRS